MQGLKLHINLKFLLLLLLLQIAAVKTVFPQEYYYNHHLKLGNKYFNAQPPDYVNALKQYELAKNFINNEEQKKKIDSLTANTRYEINKLFNEKENAMDEANKERSKAEDATVVARDAWKETQRSLAKTEKIISAFYFYDDRFALAYKNNKYGFINKEGDLVIPYKYEEAHPFDYNGLSRVRYNKQLYLLDNKTKEYKMAIGPDNLDSTIRALDLSNRQLTELPAKNVYDSNIRILLLNGNEITQLDSSITRFSRLGKFFIYNNKLEKLPDEIGSLLSLITLDASINKLLQLPETIGNLDSLEELILYDNNLSGLPESLGDLKRLISLDLSDNLLSSLPEKFKELDSLRVLALGENQFKEFPAGLKYLPGLTMLDLGSNFMDSIPAWIDTLDQLTRLYILNNQLESLPFEITKIDSLKVLVAGNNRLVSLPANMDSLQKLEELVLYGNKLTAIPAELVKLKELKKLDLRKNEFRDPGSALSVFKDSDKKLIISASDTYLDYFASKNTLLIRVDNLKAIPNQLSDSNNLVFLDIYNYRDFSVEDIQSAFKSNKNTRVYSSTMYPQVTDTNQLLINVDIIPFLSLLDTAQARKLINLDLSRRNLTEIPAGVFSLQNLESLNLSGNSLKEIPVLIYKLAHLKLLDIRENLIEEGELKSIIERIKAELPACEVLSDQVPE